MKQRNAEFGAKLSIIVYIALSTTKVIVGKWAHSQALYADGLNNFTDVFASIAVLVGLRIAKKPRDEDHPYGHSRAENIASLVASIIMVSIGLQVISEAVLKWWNGTMVTPEPLAIYVGLASAVIMFVVYRFNAKLAKETKSSALMAAAKDHLSDALVSIGTVVGIFAAMWSLVWLDAVTAIIIGLVICYTAYEIFREASHLLTDGYNEEKLADYRECIASVAGVLAVKDVKARKIGVETLIDVTIIVDHHLDVIQSHAICDEVENHLADVHDVKNVHVHIEPNV